MASTVDGASEQMSALGACLRDASEPMGARFRALFALRSLGGPAAVAEIAAAFGDESALLKHELAFCLGQMGHRSALPILRETLGKLGEDPMVRHECGEALGAIGDPSAEDILRRFAEDPAPEVAETCALALRRLRWVTEEASETTKTSSPYESVDPTPPPASETSVAELRSCLLDAKAPLWERYRAMFGLRNAGGAEAVAALAAALACPSSALLRHEVAYVLGQMQDPAATAALSATLAKTEEAPMVRHEAAEALGSIGTKEAEEILARYAEDPEPVVAESVAVALDISEAQGQDFQPLSAS